MDAFPLPADGDILVTKPTAVVEHAIAIVPASPQVIVATHDEALAWARRAARELAVDAWLCEDHRNFLRIASFRQPLSG